VRISVRLALLVAVVASGVVALAPTSANATGATYNVQLDAQPPKGEPWSFLRMFPAQLKVHRGDIVNFAWDGIGTPHTATVVPNPDPDLWRKQHQGSGARFETFISDTAAGGDDHNAVVNPHVAFPSDFSCGSPGTPCTFDGSGVVSSGLQFSSPGSQPAFDVDITAPVGHYSFLCLLHPGMQIPVTVVRSGQTIPSPSDVDAKITQDVGTATTVDGEAADTQAQTVTSAPRPNGTTKWSISAGGFSNNVSADEYPDNPVTVRVGDRIQVSGNFEIHTATFPATAFNTVPFVTTVCEVPGADPPAASPFDCADPSQFRVDINPQAITPTSTLALRRPKHFVNSGLLLPSTTSTFRAVNPGTYTFICLVHGPQMSGTIDIKPAK